MESAAPGKVDLRHARKARTRSRILHEALNLFRTIGYHGTSVEKIAAAAQVTRMAFYAHFPDKEAVLDVLVAGYLERLTDYTASLPGPVPTRPEVDRWLRGFVRFIEAERAFVELIVAQASLSTSGDLGQKVVGAFALGLSRTLPCFRLGSEEGQGDPRQRALATSVATEITFAALIAARQVDLPYENAVLDIAAERLLAFAREYACT